MLVNFSFSNYKCFKDKVTLSLVSCDSKGDGIYSKRSEFSYSVLKSIVIYGANASGKSKLFDALLFFKSIVCPPKINKTVPLFDFWCDRYKPFGLNDYSETEPSEFEVVFIIGKIQYRYGIKIKKNKIISEWLYRKEQREAKSFVREDNKFDVTSHIDKKIADNLIKSNMISESASFLTILKTFNEPLAIQICDWFNNISIISGNELMGSDMTGLMDNDMKNKVISLIKNFDFNIEDFKPHEISKDDIPEKIKQSIGKEKLESAKFFDDMNTYHKFYNSNYERMEDDAVFSLSKDESWGTNRLVRLSLSIISALEKNSLIFIDEFDSGFHSLVLQGLMELFYLDKDSEAQIVCNLHNTSLLDAKLKHNPTNKLLRKDQVYFTNKNRYGEATIDALTDYEGDLRSSIEKKYLSGEFDAVPCVNLNYIIERRSYEE